MIFGLLFVISFASAGMFMAACSIYGLWSNQPYLIVDKIPQTITGGLFVISMVFGLAWLISDFIENK